MTIQPALASGVAYEPGNTQTGTYGVQADIYTPGAWPYTEVIQASWVAVNNGPNNANSWVQTGWLYDCSPGDPWYNNIWAVSYTELQIFGGTHDVEFYGVHNWSSSKNYKILFVQGAVGWWVLYIDNSLKVLYNDPSLPTPPTPGLAWSEVQNSTSTYLLTSFNNVQYRDSTGNWHLFNQNNYYNALPYHVLPAGSNIDYSYTTWGP